MSAIETPQRDGWSALPVTPTSPASAWMSMSYAFLSRYGPASPYPEMSQTTTRGSRLDSVS
jgi:hypothetical protein